MFEIKQKQKADQSGKRDNITGIPVQMKAYAENLYGSSLDHVRVHYQSEKPRQFHALGYTQGTDVYLGPGQEKHLMHELCHVIQQKKGVVKPTSIEGGHAINDSMSLEKEAEAFEKQYEKEAPVQMLRDQAALPSETMDQPGLDPQYSDRYHVLGYYILRYRKDVMQEGSVWSYKASYARAEKGGDHAEDAICDAIECMEFANSTTESEGKEAGRKFSLNNATLDIELSSSPCKRCKERLLDLIKNYNLSITVTCAKKYAGEAGGGAADGSGARYKLIVLKGEEEKRNLLQF